MSKRKKQRSRVPDFIIIDDIDGPPMDRIALPSAPGSADRIASMIAEAYPEIANGTALDGAAVLFAGMGPMRKSDHVAKILNRGGGKTAATSELHRLLNPEPQRPIEVRVVRPSPFEKQAQMLRGRVQAVIAPSLSKALARWAENGTGDAIRAAVKAKAARKRKPIGHE